MLLIYSMRTIKGRVSPGSVYNQEEERECTERDSVSSRGVQDIVRRK